MNLEDQVRAILSSYVCHTCGNPLTGNCANSVPARQTPPSNTSSQGEEKQFSTNLMENRWLNMQKKKLKDKPVPVTVIDLKNKKIISSGVPLHTFKDYTEIPSKVLEKLSASEKTVNFARELKGEPVPEKKIKKKQQSPPLSATEKQYPKVVQAKVVDVGSINNMKAPNTHKKPLSYNQRKKLLKS